MEECLELNGIGMVNKNAVKWLAGVLTMLMIVCEISYGSLGSNVFGIGIQKLLPGEAEPEIEMSAAGTPGTAASMIKTAKYEIPGNLVSMKTMADMGEAAPGAAVEAMESGQVISAAAYVEPEAAAVNAAPGTEMIADTVAAVPNGKGTEAAAAVLDGKCTETEATASDGIDNEMPEIVNPADTGEAAISSPFLIDREGMIYGFVPEHAEITDGVLSLPSEGCRGIRRGTFLDTGAGITEIRIPANMICIEEGALMGLDDLLYISVDEGNSAYGTQDGVLYDSSISVLLAFPNGRTGGYLVPGSVVRVAVDAFYHTSVEILDMRDCMKLDPETVKIDGVRVLLPQNAV